MKCFVIMPYGNREGDPLRKRFLDSLYEDVIRPAVEAVPVPGDSGSMLTCHRGDKEPRPGEIIAHIVENLVLSEIAIADLTGRNPNVFYELGVRHAVSDNTLLISESNEDVPFDLRGQRLILYSRDFEGGARLRTAINKAVIEMVKSPGRIDNPVRRFLFNNERDEMMQRIGGQGRPPGYNFVNELLRELAHLREEVQSQFAQMSQVMKAVTTQGWGDGSLRRPGPGDDLTFLEGYWREGLGGSRLFARMINGALDMPYSYGGGNGVTGHFFNFRRIGNKVFARFEWLGIPEVSGYVLLTIENADRLVGGWWYSDAVSAEVAADISKMDSWMPGKQPWLLERCARDPVPPWVDHYFARAQGGSISSP